MAQTPQQGNLPLSWFSRLTGIERESYRSVHNSVRVDGSDLVCSNGKRLTFGSLEIASLKHLMETAQDAASDASPNSVREIVADVRDLHVARENQDALFQVASQFNLLEMARPENTPEMGVGIYEFDPTQGPACAISCGAGTIYRNYFVPVGDGLGQSKSRQIDCSSELGRLLGNDNGSLWSMKNGYLLPTKQGLSVIAGKLASADEAELDRFRAAVQFGIQWNSEVTIADAGHFVSQVYCSALPVAYGRGQPSKWAPLAKLVLDAAYEATVCAAILNRHRTGCNQLFLTLLGGGAFGNEDNWILEAIERALTKYSRAGLSVAIVSYGQSIPIVNDLANRMNRN